MEGCPASDVALVSTICTCAVCPLTVKKALEKVSGVTMAKVDFEKKTVAVTFDPDKASPDTLTKATSDAGYPSTVHN